MIPGSANPLLLKSAAAGGYQVQRSLRFNSSDSAYLSRTPAVAGNRRTWTWAAWVKRSGLGAFQSLFCCIAPNLSHYLQFTIESDDCLLLYDLVATSGVALKTTQVFRDPSAWYHIVLQYNTTNATASNKVKLYVNGSEITQFSVDNRSSLTSDSSVNRAEQHSISGRQPYSTEYFNGYLADIHFIDGQALTPSSFTEVSATTGQLIPKAYSGGSYGTNGFYLQFADNSSNTATTLGKDTSGNSNNWTPNNFSVTGILNYSSNVTTVATSVYSGTPATMFNGGTSIYYGVTSSSGNSSISIDLTGKSVSVSSSVRVYASFRTGQVWQINGSTVSSSGVTHPNTGWQTLSGWSAGAITSFSNSVPSGSANEIYAIEIDGVILTNNTGAGNDSLVDTPTSFGTDTGVGNEVRGNYATWNPLEKAPLSSLTDGNLLLGGTAVGNTGSTIAVNSGKWYWELDVVSVGNERRIGVIKADKVKTDSGDPNTLATGPNGYAYCSPYGGFKANANANTTTGYTQWDAGNIVSVALDMDNGKVYFARNGTWQESGNPATGANPAFTGLSGFFTAAFFADNSSTVVAINFGQRAFAYTAPSGFKALCDTNLGAPLVAKPNTVMDVKLYTGTGSTQTISGLSFSPDLVWTKGRSIAELHLINDSVRGVPKNLYPNLTNAEDAANYLSALTSDGFTVTNQPINNSNGNTYVAWAWDAGTSTVSNGSGSITSQVRANVSAGFSVITWTSPSSGDYTIGHGLGVAPSLVITKSRSAGGDQWYTFHRSVCTSTSNYLKLSSTDGLSTFAGAWGATLPTSTVVGLNAGGGFIPSSATAVAYAFAPVVGYSNGFSYTGNGSTDGVFQYLGFRPRLILLKCSSTTGNWTLLDTAREGYNVDNDPLYPNLSNAEGTTDLLDITSNGFKLRTTDASVNSSGATYIGFAWAENPFQYARAR